MSEAVVRESSSNRWRAPWVGLVVLLLVGLQVLSAGEHRDVEAAPLGAACSPRPPVRVQTQPESSTTLLVTVTATTSASTPTNQLSQIRFAPVSNALVSMPGKLTNSAGNVTVTFAAGTTSAQFSARRIAGGQSMTVPVTVVDSCGDWTTFVGGGASFGVGLPTPTATPLPTATVTPAPTATVAPTATSAPTTARRANLPRFSGSFVPGEAAVFWYGRVTPSENYTDVRISYSATDLWVQANIMDMHLRYDTAGQTSRLEEFDAVGVTLTAPTGTYRFVSGLNWFEARTNYQRSVPTVPFTTSTGWRGNAPNSAFDSQSDDRGWVATFQIPFASLGLSTPVDGAVWPLEVITYDRDDQAGAQRSQASWSGEIRFGLPSYTAPTTPAGTVSIRQTTGGTSVPDAAVGGGADCGGAADPVYFDQWGSFNYAGRTDMNVQNQSDIGDWPCFSKYYVTFPLGSVPSGKRIVSARLVMHQFGGSGSASDTLYPSLIQVATTDPTWTEGTITWNTAPLARENVSRAVVPVFKDTIVWPGVERTWDVSAAVATAYASGSPLALVLYSPDEPYHSGKYFVTSNTGDWNAAGRPTLEVTWGN
ncbi:MAG: DNRLRE domain-containing protein [Chloroflexi bacterium]|nr:DNRLRE domain-containing protein [Chloroflexota bacterium]